MFVAGSDWGGEPMSISRGWIAALAVTVFMVAGPAQAAPVLYTFTGGSAVLRVTWRGR